MTRLVAIEWDAKEARVAVGRKRGTALVVERALAVPLPERGEGVQAEPDVGPVLAKALAEVGVSKSEVLVAVGRASIELRFLSTPPVPPEEQPDIVRFQAMRQFTTLAEEWPLDFVPLAPNADGGMNVLAAAIAPELLAQIRKDCQAAGVTVHRLVLRPFAAAALLKGELGDGKCRMIVDLLAEEADLTVVIGPDVIFPRTVRLPSTTDTEILGRTLLAEGRRTMIAAQNQLGGRRVEEVIIYGDGEHHTVLKQLLEKELSLDVRLVDPLQKVEWEDARAKKPEYPGAFAPLVGMMLEEAAGTPPVLDFLHPRKRPAPPDKKRAYLLAGAGLAAIFLLGCGYLQWSLWTLDSQIAQLRTTRTKAEKAAKESTKPVKDAETLDAFAAGDVTWLDELSRLSQKLPPPEQVQIGEVTAQVVPKAGGGQIKFVGYADTSQRVADVEDALRDEKHNVSGKGLTPDPEEEYLPWTFDETLVILPPTGATPAAKSAQPKSAQSKSAPTKAAPPAKSGGAK
jgi:Tfp pilus assembly PilM family ATPase